mmetsp:Transcript_41445/g.100141  ORF Transcript_41445/g.100141 Transcript_41445/m.100141 type:complete len:210 (-) Transcript_41445:984-1613(-)
MSLTTMPTSRLLSSTAARPSAPAISCSRSSAAPCCSRESAACRIAAAISLASRPTSGTWPAVCVGPVGIDLLTGTGLKPPRAPPPLLSRGGTVAKVCPGECIGMLGGWLHSWHIWQKSKSGQVPHFHLVPMMGERPQPSQVTPSCTSIPSIEAAASSSLLTPPSTPAAAAAAAGSGRTALRTPRSRRRLRVPPRPPCPRAQAFQRCPGG